MTVVQQIELVRQWVEVNICSQIQLKKPNDKQMDSSYPYTLVHPSVYAMFMPGKDRIPEGKSTIPAISVQLVQGTDYHVKGINQLNLQLNFAVWNPGIHKEDIVIASGIKANELGTRLSPSVKEKTDSFSRTADGWQDLWNFMDIARNQLSNHDIINGLRVVREEPISYGFVSEQDAIIDYHPYYFGWLTLSIESGIVRNNLRRQELL